MVETAYLGPNEIALIAAHCTFDTRRSLSCVCRGLRFLWHDIEVAADTGSMLAAVREDSPWLVRKAIGNTGDLPYYLCCAIIGGRDSVAVELIEQCTARYTWPATGECRSLVAAWTLRNRGVVGLHQWLWSMINDLDETSGAQMYGYLMYIDGMVGLIPARQFRSDSLLELLTRIPGCDRWQNVDRFVTSGRWRNSSARGSFAQQMMEMRDPGSARHGISSQGDYYAGIYGLKSFDKFVTVARTVKVSAKFDGTIGTTPFQVDGCWAVDGGVQCGGRPTPAWHFCRGCRGKLTADIWRRPDGAVVARPFDGRVRGILVSIPHEMWDKPDVGALFAAAICRR